MNREEIILNCKAFPGGWYHAIELAPGYFTPSCMTDSFPIWEMVRKVRAGLNYGGASVLDLGTMDGMWAFEAEKLGAGWVVAADIWQGCSSIAFERFMFARRVLNSYVFPVTNGNANELADRLEDVRRLLHVGKGFEIIQCLGLLYHVQDPLRVLHQIRTVLAPGGAMLLETAVWNSPFKEPAARLNTDNGIYCDPTTFWVPNQAALEDMLKLANWTPILASLRTWTHPASATSHRACLICR